MSTTRKAKCHDNKVPRTAKAVFSNAPVEWTTKAAEGDEKQGPPTFTSVAYSGGLLPGYTLDPPLPLPYVIDLEGMTASPSAKCNLEHEKKQRVGHIQVIDNDKRQVKVAGVLSAATAYRDEVVNSAKDGYPWECSLEASLSQPKVLAAGKTEIVNGQTVTGPVYIYRKSKFTDLAFTGRGADRGNSVSVAASAAGENKMDEFQTWLAANDFDPEAMTDKQMAVAKAAFDREKDGGTKTRTSSRSPISEFRDAEKAEVERQETIARLTHDAIKEHRHNEKMMDAIAEMGEKAIKENQNATDFELALYRATRVQASAFRIVNREEPNEIVWEAALARAAGLPNVEKHYSEQVLDAVDRKLKNFSLQSLLIRAACANGYDYEPGEKITTGNLKRILKFALPDDDDSPRRARATQFSTINLPGVFGNVANKELLTGFQEEDSSWREISRIATATDFKTVTAYRLTDSLEYELLPKGGEIKHGKLGEESYTRTLKTYAKMLGLDRQDIINDDLSAFDDLRTRLGRGAARKFNNVFWAAFMNNAAFFTAARGNFISGATTNLGTDGVGLGLGVTAFQKLLSSDGKRIGGTPRILLVPPELQYVADQLFQGGSGENQTVANTNVFRGKYRPVVVPWLSDTSFTGNSTKKWYLLRDPAILAAMVVSFLNGNQAPTVESTDADFNNLGILFRGFHDFSADQAEYLAGIASKGEA